MKEGHLMSRYEQMIKNGEQITEDVMLGFPISDMIEYLDEDLSAFDRSRKFWKFVNPSYKCCECKYGHMCPKHAWWSKYIRKFRDTHELWLLRYMFEKHNKVWISRKWVEYDPVYRHKEDDEE